MRNQTTMRTFSILAFLLVGMMAWQSHALKQISPSEPAVVVSIDIERVFSSLEERAFELAKVQAIVTEMENDLKSSRAHIESYEQEFELYQPGSEKWEELMQEQQLAALEYESQVEYSRRRAVREEAKSMRKVYASIRASAKELSKQNGWDYVFVNDSLVALPDNNNVDMGAEISSRRLIYANETFDVTDVLVEYMNAEFDEMAAR